MSRNAYRLLCLLDDFVTSRKGRVSRNHVVAPVNHFFFVTSRKGRVSRNRVDLRKIGSVQVTSRKGRVSRNIERLVTLFEDSRVTSRKGRVSRNDKYFDDDFWSEMSRPARDV